MKFQIILATILLTVAEAEDIQNEITSNTIIQTSSTEQNIEPRDFLDKALIVRPSNLSQKSRRSRYLRQAPRPRRRPPYDYQVPRRPSNRNYPNLYGPRNRFKPNEARFRPGPPKFRYQYHRDNWRQKWPDNKTPYYVEGDMDMEVPIDEYDDIDEYKNDDDAYYSKKYRDDIYDDAMPVAGKYNEKRSPPHRYVDSESQKTRNRYGTIVFPKELPQWRERNRFSNHYRNYVEMMANTKQYVDENSMVGHRFRYNHPNIFKLVEEDEFDFSATPPGSKNRRFKKGRQPVFQFRRSSSTEETPYEDDFADISKYSTTIRNSLPNNKSTQKVVYQAKYHGHEPVKVDNEKDEMKIDETRPQEEPSNVVHDWKREQRQQNADYYNQFLASNNAQPEYDKSSEGSIINGRKYKDDHLLPSELIAYMSADPADTTFTGKEERYLHAAFPFIEKFTDDDILKSAYLRNISPTSDHNMEIIFDERVGNWKH